MTAEGGEPAEGSAGPVTGPVPSRRLRWGPVCGLAALVYVAGVAVDRMLLAVDGAAYTTWHERLDGPVPRVALALVLVATLFHALDGVRRLVETGASRPAPWAGPAVAFATGAVGVPLAVAVVWPWLGSVLG